MLRIIGATDKGMRRYVNEDRFAGEVFSPELAYGVVCDGMGGENAGGVASALACEEIRRMLESSCRPGMEPRSVYMILESAVATANAIVYDKAAQDLEALRGMEMEEVSWFLEHFAQAFGLTLDGLQRG